jgi:hypothetical protein
VNNSAASKSLANHPLHADFANYQPDSALELIPLNGENDP